MLLKMLHVIYAAMSEAFNKGTALNYHKRTPENSTPTTIEEFAKVFAQAYQNS